MKAGKLNRAGPVLVEAIERNKLGELDGNEVGIGGDALYVWTRSEKLFAGI